MNRIGYSIFAALALVTLLCSAHVAQAAPTVNGALVLTRIFDDCPSATVNTSNNFPAQIQIQTLNNDCFGFTERHGWDFSADGGATAIDFGNGDNFTYCATVVEDGSGGGEAGLRLSPWWSLEVDGMFNARATDGEIASFGGRLPFYSFTAAQGLHYVKGQPVYMQIDYHCNGLSQSSPATIVYSLVLNGIPYASGPLAFDEGNPAENPPYGLWGMLNDGRVGGHLQYFLSSVPPPSDIHALWEHICYSTLDATPTESTTWGAVKALYR
jgi:hypothetical protein